jgi:beta-lactamase superfamily II metal-dependent hydrolase
VAPGADEVEISLFGPGYGEAILIHSGNGEWLAVDSCLEPVSGEPVGIRYLEGLKVDLRRQVHLIVATHWHDDHVRGLSALYESCIASRLVISSALQAPEFLALTEALGTRGMMISSGVREFSKIVALARSAGGARHARIDFALANTILWRAGTRKPGAILYSLSPSSASLHRSLGEIARLIPNPSEPKRRVYPPTPNHFSVVLALCFKEFDALFGSDMEELGDPTVGWEAIVSSKARPSVSAEVVKVPHHGSKNAHHDGMWRQMTKKKPIAVLTPFRRGAIELPTKYDVNRIKALSSALYQSAKKVDFRISRRFKVKQVIGRVARHLAPVHKGFGHIRLRRKASSGRWRVELFGDAVRR